MWFAEAYESAAVPQRYSSSLRSSGGRRDAQGNAPGPAGRDCRATSGMQEFSIHTITAERWRPNRPVRQLLTQGSMLGRRCFRVSRWLAPATGLLVHSRLARSCGGAVATERGGWTRLARRGSRARHSRTSRAFRPKTAVSGTPLGCARARSHPRRASVPPPSRGGRGRRQCRWTLMLFPQQPSTTPGNSAFGFPGTYRCH